MKLKIYESYKELSLQTAGIVAEIIRKKPDALLCFAAGETSTGTYNQLLLLYESGKISFKECRIAGLDEWLNLGTKKKENCYSFLKNHLFDRIDLAKENICFFDGETNNPQQECRKTEEFIKKYGPIDLLLLGIGMNGHVGLNEPGTAWDLSSHVVKLHKITKTIGKKYFHGEVNLNKGITLGPQNMLQSETAILQISGLQKAGITKKLIDSSPGIDFPASLIKCHKNAYLFLDQEAAQLL